MKYCAFLFALVLGAVRMVQAGDLAVDVTSYALSDEGTLTANLALADHADGIKLYVACGATDGGESESGWTKVAYLQDCGAHVDAVSYTGFSGLGQGSGIKFVRFLTREGTTVLGWSQALSFEDVSKPVVDNAAGLERWRGDGFLASCRVPYAAGTVASVVAQVSRDGTFSDAQDWPAALNTTNGLYEALVQTDDTTSPRYIVPGDTVSLRFRVRNASDKTVYTSPFNFATAAGSAWASSLALTSSSRTITATATLSPFGAHRFADDGTRVIVFAGTSEDSLADIGVTNVVTREGEVSVSFVADGLVKTCVRLLATNECATAAWSALTDVASRTPTDQSSYFWTGDAGNGLWSDRNNWTNSDPIFVDCPTNAGNAAVFDGVTGIVYLDGAYTIASLALRGGATDVTFTSTDRDSMNGVLAVTLLDQDSAAGSKATFDRCTFGCGNLALAGNALSFTDGAVFRGASDETIRLEGENSRLSLDDTTTENLGDLAFGGTVAAKDTSLVLGGKGVSMRLRTVTSANGGDGSVVFDVPLGGYDAAPLGPLAEDDTIGDLFAEADPAGSVTLSISPKSRAFATTTPVEVNLIDWRNDYGRTIVTNRVRFAEMSSAYNVGWIWTYGADASETPDGSNPTGLKATVSSNVSATGGFRMIFRP